MDGLNRHLLYTSTELDKDTTIKIIFEEVAEVFETTIEAITGKRRHRWECVYPRQLIMYLIHTKYKHMTLTKVGSYFAGEDENEQKDHATVLHAYKAIDNLLHYKWGDIDFIDKYDNVINNLYNRHGIVIK